MVGTANKTGQDELISDQFNRFPVGQLGRGGGAIGAGRDRHGTQAQRKLVGGRSI